MKKFSKNAPLALIAIMAVTAFMPTSSHAGTDPAEAPIVPVSSYVNDNSPIVENPDDLTVDDVAAYLQAKHDALDKMKGNADTEYFRIQHFDPTSAAGKIVIRVHESTDPSKPEFLEVFRQKSADPTDLEALELFDGGTSNRCLASTAGTFNGKKYSTPTGDFAIDSLEVMHISKTYNDAQMPDSMFFDQGIAIHAALGGEIAHLGRVASHGCVRIHPTNAKILFDTIKGAGRLDAVVEIMAS
jgi:hypothetical protein